MTLPQLEFATPAVAAFSAELQSAGQDFLCHGFLPAARVQLSFIGPFQGKRVRWEMTLATLESLRQHSHAAIPCPFITIAPGRDGIYPLQVGLELAEIDEPALRKSLIMIRNYKRLAVGRLEFCPNLSGA